MKKLFCLVLMSWSAFGQEQKTPMMTDRAAARFLDQATWGPTSNSIKSLAEMGIEKWLATQFAATPSDLPDQPILAVTGTTNTNLTPVIGVFYQNAVSGPDQLRQRVAFILSQIWVVSQVTVQPAYAFPPYWRIFRDNAFGSYADIIKSVTLSPAMGNYLNMANNNKGNATTGTSANENYARELMQLFTLGLTELNPNGTPKVDSTNTPIPTYNQSAVTNLAKALTGWTYPLTPGATAKNNNPAYYFGQMYAVEAEHDTTAKAIFNNLMIPAGQTAEQDLTTVIVDLMQQPTLAPFVSKQLIQHMVTSNPSQAYVQRISQVFSSTGGDMKSVITAILTDPEARAGDDAAAPVNPDFGRLREPMVFMTDLARGLNGTVSASNSLNNYSTQMDENLFNPPTVFSYFSPLNPIQGGLMGPEFQIYSTQTATYRANVVSTALYGSLDTTTALNLTPFTEKSKNVDEMVQYIGRVFVHNNMSSSLRQAAIDAANAQSTATAKAQAALYVVLTSGEYQVIQ